MFHKPRYATQGVMTRIPVVTQQLLWRMIDDVPAPKDYLQVFRLSNLEGAQKIIHTQEIPPYRKAQVIPIETPVWGKAYVIDDGDHATMLMSDEY